MNRPVDCIIVGGGPAGLTAAIYLARFHLDVRLFDCGTSRAATIPRTRNHAGYPGGITGTELLDRMRAQAAEFGVQIERAAVRSISTTAGSPQEDPAFNIVVDGLPEPVGAATILLATGVVNTRPDMPAADHDAAVARGLIRYCPVCDGFEVTDRRVGVIGTADHGMREALFLRSFTADLTLIAPGAAHELDAACQLALEEAAIVRVEGPSTAITPGDGRISVATAAGTLQFDSIYPALGSRIRSELAVAAGARASPDGCLEVDSHQATTVKGLYAAGDVVKGLDQISHAMGEAGVAATAIRNLLAERTPLRR